MPFYTAIGTTAPGLKVGGSDLSNHVQSIEVPYALDSNDVTAMGAVSHAYAAGLRDDKIVVTFYQDFASGSVDAVINGLVGSATGATVVAYANGVTASATAPSYTLLAWVQEYSPINVGNPGEVSTTQVTFLPIAGQSITRGTA